MFSKIFLAIRIFMAVAVLGLFIAKLVLASDGPSKQEPYRPPQHVKITKM